MSRRNRRKNPISAKNSVPAALRRRLGQRRRRKSPASSCDDEDVSPAHSLTSLRKERLWPICQTGWYRSLLYRCLPREQRDHPLDI